MTRVWNTCYEEAQQELDEFVPAVLIAISLFMCSAFLLPDALLILQSDTMSGLTLLNAITMVTTQAIWLLACNTSGQESRRLERGCLKMFFICSTVLTILTLKSEGSCQIKIITAMSFSFMAMVVLAILGSEEEQKKHHPR